MRLPIRAFLFVYSSSEHWEVKICRDLESVHQEWRTCLETKASTFVLHLGFDRPHTDAFSDIAGLYIGRVLLTGAAKHGLPPGYETTDAPVATINDLPLFLATSGWGYALSATETDPLPSESTYGPNLVEAEWIHELIRDQPYIQTALTRAGIIDDATYVQFEARLEEPHRRLAARYRFWNLAGDATDDPCNLARAAPPWLARRRLRSFEMPPRVASGLRNLGIERVSDLALVEPERLKVARNYGRRSEQILCETLIKAVAESRIEGVERSDSDSEEPVDRIVVTTRSTLQDEVVHFLGQLPERDKAVFARRMGLGGPAETLQEIAQDFGVTRERIRQIEARIFRRLRAQARWLATFVNKINALREGRDFPLPVLGVEAVDGWLVGIRVYGKVLCQILAEVGYSELHVVQIDGIEFFGKINQAAWDKAVDDGQELLRGGAGQSWSEEYCKSVVFALLGSSAAEFRDLLWTAVTTQCHFAGPDLGQRTLVGYGIGIEPVTVAILTESEEPLHYSEIAERAASRLGRPVDPRRAHSAAAEVAILLGRGIFGLDKHVRFPKQEYALLVSEVEQIIAAGPPGRQWHTSEILDAIMERRAISSAGLNQYVIDYLLRGSETLDSLGRMTWKNSSTDVDQHLERINVRQAVIAILQDAGSPLSTDALKHQLVAARGVSRTFQVFPFDPIIRVGRGLWGLNDRDAVVPRSEQVETMNRMVDLLESRGTGIHVLELGSAGLLTTDDPALPDLLFSLAFDDKRLSVDQGQYFYLTKWGGSRRLSTYQAVEVALEQATGALRLGEIAKIVERLTMRPVDRGNISSALQSLNAQHDLVLGAWTKAAQDIENGGNPEVPDLGTRIG